MKQYLLILFSIFLLSFTTVNWSKAPRVVTSIKPLHSIVSAVMQGIAEPELLLQGNESPHNFQMKPSQRQLIAQADIIFYTAPELEGFLTKTLTQLPDTTQAIALAEAPDITLLPVRTGENWEETHAGHTHHHEHYDTHIWLSPANANVMVTTIAATLSAFDPDSSTHYNANAAKFNRRLKVLNEEIATQLEPVRDKPFVVFHDAYHYFEHAYHLNNIGSITLDPQHSPSAKRLYALRQKIEGSGFICAFSEPQFPPQLIQTVTEGTKAKTGQLDPIGSTIPASPDMYFTLLQDLAGEFVDCLQET